MGDSFEKRRREQKKRQKKKDKSQRRTEREPGTGPEVVSLEDLLGDMGLSEEKPDEVEGEAGASEDAPREGDS
ncbi:MAG: hypothetical protein RL562_1211 [Planctomycetota bacterium]|jgi:hypothetical protein